MKTHIAITILLSTLIAFCPACGDDKEEPPVTPEDFRLTGLQVSGEQTATYEYTNVSLEPVITVAFSVPLDKASASMQIELRNAANAKLDLSLTFENTDRSVVLKPVSPLDEDKTYTLHILPTLTSAKGTQLNAGLTAQLTTRIDTHEAFPRIPDEELLDLVQQQTLRYFTDFAHPVSGMARERSTSGDIVTTGGTGFGIMAIIVGAERGFLSRDEACEQVLLIADFLANKCTSYHGAFAHWVNGSTGETVAFSTYDDGADLVETSFLMQGLLTARQYFNRPDATETQLRDLINSLWLAVEWDWFRQGAQNKLFWHWSETHGWQMNMAISGWNECLITYVLAAASPTHSIPKQVYTEGWARNGDMRNGGSYYDHVLPLGSAYGGPMFFAHYSFMGLDPRHLHDTYADYWQQNRSHALINRGYCVSNPKSHAGYSAECWGLTACDGNDGYSAHSPLNDLGVIAPTAALSSMPYVPDEAMQALHHFYYKRGDKLFKQYGFVDAFNPTANWTDSQFLAIDQGPIVVMIENHRSGLLWDTFMTCPEVQAGLDALGFSYTAD